MITDWPRHEAAKRDEIVPRDGGIYGLFIGDELIYIGRTKNLWDRLGVHRRKTGMTHFVFKVLPAWLAYRYESLRIAAFRPRLNKHVMKPETLRAIRGAGRALNTLSDKGMISRLARAV